MRQSIRSFFRLPHLRPYSAISNSSSHQHRTAARTRFATLSAESAQPAAQPIAQIAEANERDEAIGRAYAGGGYGLNQIGDYFGLHYPRASRIQENRRLANGKT